MATHTPGPWRVDTWVYLADPSIGRMEDKHELCVISDEHQLAVMRLSPPAIRNGVEIKNPFGVQPEAAMANARLMASAPLLLDALDRLQANPNDPRMHRLALDAMKAARGEI